MLIRDVNQLRKLNALSKYLDYEISVPDLVEHAVAQYFCRVVRLSPDIVDEVPEMGE